MKCEYKHMYKPTYLYICRGQSVSLQVNTFILAQLDTLVTNLQRSKDYSRTLLSLLIKDTTIYDSQNSSTREEVVCIVVVAWQPKFDKQIHISAYKKDGSVHRVHQWI